jgi:hypothetical protein
MDSSVFNAMTKDAEQPAVARFEPVRTVADLDTLDAKEIVEGYRSAERGDPEPGLNRGRAFWHGWRNRMIDCGELPHDDASRQLVHEYLATERRRRARTNTMKTKTYRQETADVRW